MRGIKSESNRGVHATNPTTSQQALGAPDQARQGMQRSPITYERFINPGHSARHQ
jgi:hypothetical protein